MNTDFLHTFGAKIYVNGKLKGSGIAISDSLVLTAAHVVRCEQEESDCKVTLEFPNSPAEWFADFERKMLDVLDIKYPVINDNNQGSVQAQQPTDLDIAVIELKDSPLNIDLSDTELSSVCLEQGELWYSSGFPVLHPKYENEKSISLGGPACPNPSTLPYFEIEHTEVTQHGKVEDWQGLSGAPVVAKSTEKLVGIVAHVPDYLPQRISVVSIPYLLANTNFKQICSHLFAPKATSINRQLILDALNQCEPSLKLELLKVWQASDSAERATENIVSMIAGGEVDELTHPFDRVFDAYFSEGIPSLAVRQQITALVKSIGCACACPIVSAQPLRKFNVKADNAWKIKLRLLAAQSSDFSDIDSNDGLGLDDSLVRALTTEGGASAGDEWERFAFLVELLAEKFKPAAAKPPHPHSQRKLFERYCKLLDSHFKRAQKREDLFFYLMKQSESDEVLDLFESNFPHLISFICEQLNTHADDFFIDCEVTLEGWIAEWVYKCKDFVAPPQESHKGEQKTQAQ